MATINIMHPCLGVATNQGQLLLISDQYDIVYTTKIVAQKK